MIFLCNLYQYYKDLIVGFFDWFEYLGSEVTRSILMKYGV